MGGYAGRIQSGGKPSYLPVQQVTRLEMALNLKTAKARGLTIPLALLARADEMNYPVVVARPLRPGK